MDENDDLIMHVLTCYLPFDSFQMFRLNIDFNLLKWKIILTLNYIDGLICMVLGTQ